MASQLTLSLSGQHAAGVSLPKKKPQRDWALCMEVNLCFMDALFETAACLACGGIIDASTSSTAVFRSWFVAAVACRAGHAQRPPAPGPSAEAASRQQATCVSLCKSCDKDYVLRVVQGTILCCRDGCRHRLVVSKKTVQDALCSRPALMSAFFDLIDEYDCYDCVIHADTVPASSTPASSRTLMDACQHERNACDDCLKTMCETAIEGDRLRDLACPDAECRTPFSRGLIRRLVSKDHLKLYDKKLAFLEMAKNETFRWCRCGHGQTHEAGAASPEWRCFSCNARHCFVCRADGDPLRCDHLRKLDRERDVRALLEGRSRDEHLADERRRARLVAEQMMYDKRENAEGTMVVIALASKRCPRLGCRARLERISGCAHMTCAHCQTEFCWCCKVIWKAGAFGAAGPREAVPLHLDTCSLAQQFRSDKTVAKTALPDKDAYAVGWDEDEAYNKAHDRDLWVAQGHV